MSILIYSLGVSAELLGDTAQSLLPALGPLIISTWSATRVVDGAEYKNLFKAIMIVIDKAPQFLSS